MSRGIIDMDAFGTCHADDCDTVAPWDMAAIAVNDTHLFCSPACANGFLDGTTEPIEVVSLHDPQYHADRPDGIDDDCVTVWREVHGRHDARAAVSELDDMLNGPFRV